MKSLVKKQKVGVRVKSAPTLTIEQMESMSKKEILKLAETTAESALVQNQGMTAIQMFGYASRLESFAKQIKDSIKPHAQTEALQMTTITTKNNVNIAKFPQQVFGELKITGSVKEQYNTEKLAQFVAKNVDEEYKQINTELSQLEEQAEFIKNKLTAKKVLLKQKTAEIVAHAPAEIRKPIGTSITLSVK